MLPNVAGEAATKRQIFAYSIPLAAVGMAPWAMGFAGLLYGIVAAALGAGFVWYAYRVLRMPESDRAMKPAKQLFGFSLLYLFGIFAVLMADIMLSRFGATGF